MSVIAIAHILDDIFTGEVEGIASSICGAALIALNLPTEEYLTFGSSRHAVRHHSCGVINDVIGIGIGNFSRTLTQIILHAKRRFFAANLDKLEHHARIAENAAVGVLNGIDTVVVANGGKSYSNFPVVPSPIPVPLLICSGNFRALPARRKLHHFVDNRFPVAIICVHMNRWVLIPVGNAELEFRR